MSALSDLFQSIADAIRGKNGNVGKLTPHQFPDAIAALEMGAAKKTIIGQQTSDAFVNDNDYGLYGLPIYDATIEGLVVGEEYEVYWNGETYTCTAIDTGSVISGSISLGDGTAFGFSGNGEPFMIVYNPDWEGYNLFSLEDSATNEFALYQNEAGSKLKYKSGWWQAPATTSTGYTVTDDIGFVPDFLIVYTTNSVKTSGAAILFFGTSPKFEEVYGSRNNMSIRWTSSYSKWYGVSNYMTEEVNTIKPLSGVTENGFTLGYNKLEPSGFYYYRAFGLP